jgi:hypothetical protein
MAVGRIFLEHFLGYLSEGAGMNSCAPDISMTKDSMNTTVRGANASIVLGLSDARFGAVGRCDSRIGKHLYLNHKDARAPPGDWAEGIVTRKSGSIFTSITRAAGFPKGWAGPL